jgi:hypothetical protein
LKPKKIAVLQGWWQSNHCSLEISISFGFVGIRLVIVDRQSLFGDGRLRLTVLFLDPQKWVNLGS